MTSFCYFIATSYSDNPISLHFQALAKELARGGNRVVILVDHQKYHAQNYKNNPSIYTWPSWRPTKLSDAIFLYRLIRKYHPDCLIANFGSVNIMTTMGWLAKVPFRVAWYHTLSSQINLDTQDALWKIKLLRFRKQIIYRLASHIIPVSEAAKKDLCIVFKVLDKKCKIFYNSLIDPIEELNLSKVLKDPNKIICVARLFPSKGQDCLIRAIALLKSNFPFLKVEFIGEGPLKKETYTQLAKDLGLNDNCVFLGSLPHKVVLNKMASAILSVLLSLADNCPLVVIESLAVGTPVIACAVGGIPEIIRDGIDGFLFPPNSYQVLAEKIKILLLNPKLREQMSMNARQRFLDKFEQSKAIKEQADWLEAQVKKLNKQ
ncbi:MAG: glycosyltransferase family 4 protein [Candidatus Omnitrophica bacterium]|nr:glycosyltransferase family 4 protein [Candidatus Omnitrophota bacterium]